MAKAKQVLTREQAEEFTHNLGQITAGDYGLIDMAVNTLGVPHALGKTTEEWVNESLGGYVQWTVEKRREAVSNLTADGKSGPQIAAILGISETTVTADRAVNKAQSAVDAGQGELMAPKSVVDDGPKLKIKLSAADRKKYVTRMIEEGKTDAQILVALRNDGYEVGLSTISKEKRAITKAELARIKAAAEAETTPAQKKEAEARLAEISERVTGQIQAAYGFDPYVAMKDAADMVFTVSAAGGEFDVEGTIREAMRALDELWVIGAKRGLDVSAIAHLFDRMKGDV